MMREDCFMICVNVSRYLSMICHILINNAELHNALLNFTMRKALKNMKSLNWKITKNINSKLF